jgi:hypothetical protein
MHAVILKISGKRVIFILRLRRVTLCMQAVKWGRHLRSHELFAAELVGTLHFSLYIQGVPGGGQIATILSKKVQYICTCVLFRTVSESELFYCTIVRNVKMRWETSRTWVAKCIYVDGGIFENVLTVVNCTNVVTWTINTGIRNST